METMTLPILPGMGPVDAEQPRLRADARRNRERILETAHRMFATGGLDVSIDDIAAKAGVGVGTVYRHFATKEDLIRALMERHFLLLRHWLEEGLAAESAWDALVDFLYRVGEMQAVDRGFINSVASRPEVADVCAGKFGLFDSGSKLLDRAIEEGHLRPDATIDDVALVVRSIGSAAEIEVRSGIGSWRRTLELFIDGLRRSDVPG